MREITVLTDVALITCIVQRGKADAMVEAAKAAGAQGATVHFGRGSGVRERLGILGIAIDVEKEIINIVVSSEQVDRIFESMYSPQLAARHRHHVRDPLEKAAFIFLRCWTGWPSAAAGGAGAMNDGPTGS
jgi:nitrogen regulatory protein PII